MSETPEQKARETIDVMLVASGWTVQSKDMVNLWASCGVAVRELSFSTGAPGYTLFVNAKAIGTVEVEPMGITLTSAEGQSAKYLVDRGNLANQTLTEFQQFVSPINNYKFTEEYIVQRLSGNTLAPPARVVISTIQRIYSMLKGERDPAPDLDDLSLERLESVAFSASQSGSGVSPLNLQSRDDSATLLTQEQMAWFTLIRDHIATSLSIEADDFDRAPFNQRGGLGRAYQLFGDRLLKLLNELNEVLVA